MEDSTPFDEAFDATPVVAVEEKPLDEETYGLIYRGFLTSEIKIGVHKIAIRTLRIGEELEAALLAAKYRESVEYPRALATAQVAACITSVDGKQLLEERLGPQDEKLEAKFQYIQQNWYWPTIHAVHSEYMRLVQEMLDKYETVKKD